MNVGSDPATVVLVQALGALLHCNQSAVVREGIKALIGQRPPLSPADRGLLDALLRRWQADD